MGINGYMKVSIYILRVESCGHLTKKFNLMFILIMMNGLNLNKNKILHN